MFGLEIKDATTWIGWRAIHHPGKNWIDIVPDRIDSVGSKADRKRLLAWTNSGPWTRLTAWADTVSGSSEKLFIERSDDGTMILAASPKASYGYLYIGAAIY